MTHLESRSNRFGPWAGRCAVVLGILAGLSLPSLRAAELRAGVARVDITDRTVGRVNDPLHAKALVLESGTQRAVLLTIDAVAIGGIGRIGNDFLPELRRQLAENPGIPATNVLVNASHCHGSVRTNLLELAVTAVRTAWNQREPVRCGAGVGREDRISENRRLRLKDGSEVDMRRAYALPREADVASVGPIDPEIGLLRLDRLDGRPLAVVYNFACHPIMNPPSHGNSADFVGFASQLVEEALGGGAVALFVQGCAGDLNPVHYKRVQTPPEAEPLGHRLGLSILSAVRTIETRTNPELRWVRRVIELPRAADFDRRIAAIEAEQQRLLDGLKPTDINFKTFLPLYLQQRIAPDFPADNASSYLHEQSLGQDAVRRLEATQRENVSAYLENLDTMERLTRLNVNRALLRRHRADQQAAGSPLVPAEMLALRLGDFRLVTFPGELTVEIGLNLKRRAARPFTFVAGYCNGYLHYLPTVRQRQNTGYAQEDCDCLVAPEWQERFESAATELLRSLE